MPNTIRLKRGTTTPTSLVVGEPAWDSTNGNLFVGGDSAIVHVNRRWNSDIHGEIESPVNMNISLGARLPFSASSIKLSAILGGGTCSVRLRRNSTSLGTAATSITSSSVTTVDYTSVAVVSGDRLWLDVTNSSNCTNLRFSVAFDVPSVVPG